MTKNKRIINTRGCTYGPHHHTATQQQRTLRFQADFYWTRGAIGGIRARL